MFDRITSDPAILSGRPCIRGMRIPVSVIVSQIVNGATQEEILEAYPDLEPADIEQSLNYAEHYHQEKIFSRTGLQRAYIPAGIARPRRAASPIQRLVSKVGGEPVGLGDTDWPRCRQCNREMDFLVQLNLKQPVKLSRRFDFAYVFLCGGYYDPKEGHQCDSYDPLAGANCAFLREKPNPCVLSRAYGLTRYDDFELPWRIRYEPDIDSEAPGLTAEDFLDRTGTEDIREYTWQIIKVGGIPIFLQSPDDVQCPECGGAMQFIAQIGPELEHRGAGLDSYCFETAFGEIYVFKCAAECCSRGLLFTFRSVDCSGCSAA